MKPLLIASLLISGFLASGMVQAAECTATNPNTNPDAKLTNSDVCGPGGDIAGGTPNPSGAEVTAQVNDGLTYALISGLTYTGAGATSGTWSFVTDPSATDYVITMKDGATGGNSQWDWFHIDTSLGLCAAQTFCGTWTMYGTDGTNLKQLSHMDLFAASRDPGGCCTNEIPEPATLGLVGLALTVAGIARRQKLL